jgi:predicted DNA-binding ribbon-helix-helix protein
MREPLSKMAGAPSCGFSHRASSLYIAGARATSRRDAPWRPSAKAVEASPSRLPRSPRASVRLEPAMWAALDDIAVERGKTVHDVVLEMNRGRMGLSLTEAIRVYIVEYYREDWQPKKPRRSGAKSVGTSDDQSKPAALSLLRWAARRHPWRLWPHPRNASSPRTAITIAAKIAERRADPTPRTIARDRATTASLLDWLRADRRCRRYRVPGADRSRQNASSECASSKLICWQYGQAGKRRPLINLT